MRRHPLFLPTNNEYPGINDIAGPKLLGAVWDWSLYGALVVQIYVYSYNFPRDNRYIKLLVYSIFFLETVETAFTGADLYHWFAADFSNFNNLFTPFTPFSELQISSSAVSLSVQLFFSYRILVLYKKRSWWLCVIICLLSIVSASGDLAEGILEYIIEKYKGDVEVDPEVLEIFLIVGDTGTLSDLLIASAMLYHLRRIWVKDGELSSHIFVSIVRLTVETNLMSATVSIVALILGFLPISIWSLCPLSILGKLHSNTLLVYLNNRVLIRNSYEAYGAVVDCEAVTRPRSGAGPEYTAETIILEPEGPQNDSMNKPATEAEVEERVNIPVTMPLISALRRNRH